MRSALLASAAALLLSSCAIYVSPEPAAASRRERGSDDAAIAALLQRMSVERKVAQIVMPDISTITPEDVRRFRFGTILNGGNSGPGGNDKAAAAEWLRLADAMWGASTAPTDDGEPVIPLLWATDAVHGHNNVPGATIFPHNIGLGATGDEALVRRIGEATAAEIAVTGIDWTFAPTIAVTRDDRWGRTYESYSEDPVLVAKLGAAMVAGLQGRPGTAEFLDQTRVIATAKHFLGDGGTEGVDQGDVRGSLATIEAVHGSPYPPTIAAGVQSVMASFSSVNGEKMHGNRALLTGLLREEMKFDGVVVGDWNGHGQVSGCTNSDCPKALLAGLDIYMVPEEWRGLYDRLVSQMKDGTIPQARLDEAVARVLRLKLGYGLFEKPRPSERRLAGRFDLLGSPAHRDLAREAVRKSLVLLKNDRALPLRSTARVLVAGAGADSIPRQAGGWSITWQGGGDLINADFPGATSIYAALSKALAESGGQAILAPDGRTDLRPDAAVVVFGEEPYAEFSGDRKDLAYRDEQTLALIRRLRAQGVPVTAVFLSGRPMWVNRFLAETNAFVAAWLPGSEGGGIADLIVGDRQGRPRHDFSGRLSFSWPAACDSDAGNGGDGLPLFRRGQGFSYASPPPPRQFDTRCRLLDEEAREVTLFAKGKVTGASFFARDAGGEAALPSALGRSPAGTLTVRGVDRNAQEDSRMLTWIGPASLVVSAAPPGEGDLVIDYAIDSAPVGAVRLGASADLKATMAVAAGKGWRQMRIPARCLGEAPWSLTSDGPMVVRVSSISLGPAGDDHGEGCSGVF